MVTIAVMAIIATMAAPSFNNMLISQNLKTTAFNMKDTLKEARSRAMLNRNDIVVCSSMDQTGVAISTAICGANLVGYSSMSIPLQESSVVIANVEKKITVKAGVR